jgi:hypothetical protein
VLVAGLEVLTGMKVENVEVFGDSNLVVQQLRGESQCLDGKLNKYHGKCMDLIRGFDTFHIEHIHRERNRTALAQQASGYEITQGNFLIRHDSAVCRVEGECAKGQEPAETSGRSDIVPADWKYVIRECIRSPGRVQDRKVCCQALQYTVVGDDLYKRSTDGLLLERSKPRLRWAR